MHPLKDRLHTLLRFSERYTKTDMVSLASGGFWMTLGTIVSTLGSLALYVVLANTVSKEEYGIYQYLLSGSAIIGALTLTGMNTAVARAVARGFEGAVRRAVRLQLTFGIFPFLVAEAAALYYLFNDNIVLALGFCVIGIGMPIINAFNTYGAFFHGKSDFRRAFFYGLAWHLPFYGALIITAFFSPAALALLVVNLLTQGVATILLYRQVVRTQIRNDSHDPETLPYGTHLSVMNIPSTVAAQIDAVLVFHFLGAVPLALYSFATAVPERLAGFFKFLPTAALPKLSEKNPQDIRNALFGVRIWLAIGAVCGAAIAYIFIAPYLFSFVFPAYLDAVPYSQWYSLIFFAVIGNLFVTGLTANRSVKALYVFNIVTPVAQIMLQVGGILLYGLWGLIAGRLAATAFSLLLSFLLLLSHSRKDNVENSSGVL